MFAVFGQQLPHVVVLHTAVAAEEHAVRMGILPGRHGPLIRLFTARLDVVRMAAAFSSDGGQLGDQQCVHFVIGGIVRQRQTKSMLLRFRSTLSSFVRLRCEKPYGLIA